jgi:hypothetical protein
MDMKEYEGCTSAGARVGEGERVAEPLHSKFPHLPTLSAVPNHLANARRTSIDALSPFARLQEERMDTNPQLLAVPRVLRDTPGHDHRDRRPQ